MDPSHQELKAVLKQDFAAFLEKCFYTMNPGRTYYANWHLEAMGYRLEQCRKGKSTRLQIRMPPRNLKSETVSVAYTAWLLGQDPTTRIIGLSYSEQLAKKFSRATRKVMEAPWYQDLFPATVLSATKQTETEIHTTKNGYRIALSMSGSLTGQGGDYVIIDDPHPADHALSEAERKRVIAEYTESVPSRLDNPDKGVIIMVCQRIHAQDLSGHLEEKGGWGILNLPALATKEYEEIRLNDKHTIERFEGDLLHPERLSHKTLDQLKSEVGSYAFAAQYQQEPAPPGGVIFHLDWFPRYQKHRPWKDYDVIIDSWDTASGTKDGNAYSVCTTWGRYDGSWYLLDCYREQLQFTQLVRAIEIGAKQHHAHGVLIENASSGTAAWQYLSDKDIYIIPITPKGDKESRAIQVTPRLEAGRVYLPTQAPWLPEFEKELLEFPFGKYADQVDSMTQFLNWFFDPGRPRIEFRVRTYTSGGSQLVYQDKYFDRTGLKAHPLL